MLENKLHLYDEIWIIRIHRRTEGRIPYYGQPSLKMEQARVTQGTRLGNMLHIYISDDRLIDIV